MQIVNKELKSYEIIYSSASTNFVEAYYIKAVNLYEALSSFMRSKIPYKDIYKVKLIVHKETNAV
tara:strand:+ start:378 stop:572 length:195 start_codon:yes stop_codon:yes gene_type:complete